LEVEAVREPPKSAEDVCKLKIRAGGMLTRSSNPQSKIRNSQYAGVLLLTFRIPCRCNLCNTYLTQPLT